MMFLLLSLCLVWLAPCRGMESSLPYNPDRINTGRLAFLKLLGDTQKLATVADKTNGIDNTIKIWSENGLQRTIDTGNPINVLMTSPDGHLLITTFDNLFNMPITPTKNDHDVPPSQVMIFDTQTGIRRSLFTFNHPIKWATITPDNKQLIVCRQEPIFSEKGITDFYDIASKELIKLYAGPYFAAINFNRNLAATSYPLDCTKVFTFPEGTLVSTLDQKDQGSLISEPAWSPNGQIIATSPLSNVGEGQRNITLWDVSTGKEKSNLNNGNNVENMVIALQFYDDNHLVSGDLTSEVKIWDITQKKPTIIPTQGSAGIISSNKEFIAAALSNGTVQIWKGKDITSE